MPRNNKKTEVVRPGVVVPAELDALEFENLDAELAEMTRDFQPQPPRVRIEHSTTGRHRLFIDYGESYSQDEPGQVDVPGNELSGIVCYAQMIRALWTEGEAMPRCAAIDDQPAVMQPVHHSCIGCPNNNLGSKCKPKVRLLALTWVTGKPTLVVFNLSPTSIKRWRTHVNKLARSKAPYTAVMTRFSLEDTQKNTFRWAEVSMTVGRVVTRDELKGALVIRDQFKQQFADVEEADYSDPGDKVEEDK